MCWGKTKIGSSLCKWTSTPLLAKPREWSQGLLRPHSSYWLSFLCRAEEAELLCSSHTSKGHLCLLLIYHKESKGRAEQMWATWYAKVLYIPKRDGHLASAWGFSCRWWRCRYLPHPWSEVIPFLTWKSFRNSSFKTDPPEAGGVVRW